MAIKRTLSDAVNLPVQIVSLILAAFVAAGLNIDPNASAFKQPDAEAIRRYVEAQRRRKQPAIASR